MMRDCKRGYCLVAVLRGRRGLFNAHELLHWLVSCITPHGLAADCSLSRVCAVLCIGERDVLSASSGRLSGQVLLGGQERHLASFRRTCAHVKQVMLAQDLNVCNQHQYTSAVCWTGTLGQSGASCIQHPCSCLCRGGIPATMHNNGMTWSVESHQSCGQGQSGLPAVFCCNSVCLGLMVICCDAFPG